MIDFFSVETWQLVEDWIVANPGWAGFVVFTLSACESLAVVGLFIPGVVVMGIIGGLVTAGILQVVPTLAWAVLGAILGDGISYYIGWRFKEHLPNYWPFRRFPRWLERGKKFFVDHGGKSIVIGRFVGPVRPFIPVVAGMMHMRPRDFLFANIFSAVCWAPIYMLPGGIISMLFFE
jgi:membrane protein DedA with SNARE-associated domain